MRHDDQKVFARLKEYKKAETDKYQELMQSFSQNNEVKKVKKKVENKRLVKLDDENEK
jgi:cytoskeletal protein RodZ